MSYIDIFMIAISAIGLIFGLFGKASKKIMSLIVTIGSVVISMLTCGLAANFIKSLDSGFMSAAGGANGKTVGQWIAEMIHNATKEMGISEETIQALCDGIIKMLAFWLLSIILIIVLNFVARIVYAIVTHGKRKAQTKEERRKNTAIRTFGLCGLVKGFVVGLVLIFPVIAMSPVLTSLKEFDENNATMALVSNQVSSSVTIKATDKILSNTQLPMLQYEKDGQKRYLYTDFNSVKGFSKIAKLFTKLDGNENPMQSLTQLTDDEIREVFNSIGGSDTVKEIITDVINNIDESIEINLDEIDFSKEADTFIEVKNAIVFDEDGKPSLSEEADPVELAETLAKSDIVEAVAKNAEGALSDIDETTKAEIELKLTQMYGNEQIDQDKYETLMKLFQNS